ncbi:hypothetical protein BDZ88DRAFT_44138 [Geranomyces variabilis]|nr:hypothetical protein BDZ88DRAFT_44138 [Geranomyces variabilis]
MVCTARQSFSAAAAQQSITLNPVTLASFPLAGPIAASGDPVYLSFLSEIVMAPNEFSPLERRCGCLNDCLVVLDVSELARQIDANMRPVANNVALIPSGMAVALAIRVVLTAQILAGNAAALKAKSLELKRHRLRLPHKRCNPFRLERRRDGVQKHHPQPWVKRRNPGQPRDVLRDTSLGQGSASRRPGSSARARRAAPGPAGRPPGQPIAHPRRNTRDGVDAWGESVPQPIQLFPRLPFWRMTFASLDFFFFLHTPCSFVGSPLVLVPL